MGTMAIDETGRIVTRVDGTSRRCAPTPVTCLVDSRMLMAA